MKKLALILLLTVPLAAIAADEKKRLLKATEKLKEARRALDVAESELVSTYKRLEKSYESISGPNCPEFLQVLCRVWAEMEPEAKEVWQKLKGTGGSRVSAKRFENEFSEPLARKAMDSTAATRHLLHPFTKMAAELYYSSIRHGEAVTTTMLLDEAGQILTPRTPFHEFWNEHIFSKVPEAQNFSKANEGFAVAKSEWNRAFKPNEYDDQGRRLPPGMVLVQGDTYVVGPNTWWERKRKRVRIRDVYIDKYEVTNKQFNIFLKTLDEDTRLRFMPYFWPISKLGERIYPEDREDYPAIGVSWEAANAYAAWKGKRLPTEDEWEIAATGGDGRLYPWGNKFNPANCNTRESGYAGTVEVGSFRYGVSPVGCYDMSGNADEWTCSDQDGNIVTSYKGTIMNVTIRGGSYREEYIHASCLSRWMAPMDPYQGNNPSRKVIGFRCAMDAR